MLFLLTLLTALPVLGQDARLVPVTVDGERVRLVITTFKPTGAGPFPTVIFHHGSTGLGNDPSEFAKRYDPTALAGWFVARGWAVVGPWRRGRGGSEGLYDEGFMPDRSKGYSCDPDRVLSGADRALRDIDAATTAILAMPFVDRSRLLIGGQSVGGALAIAWSGLHPDLPKGAFNFVGGLKTSACRYGPQINEAIFKRGAAFSRPTLWLYGENDPYFPIAHSRANFAAFEAAGGKGSFYAITPAAGRNGHFINGEPNLWGSIMRTFLAAASLPFKG